jgi:hypothetical protein
LTCSKELSRGKLLTPERRCGPPAGSPVDGRTPHAVGTLLVSALATSITHELIFGDFLRTCWTAALTLDTMTVRCAVGGLKANGAEDMKLVSPLLSTLLRARGRLERTSHPYLCCDRCGEIAPRTEERTVSTLNVPWPAWIRLPPESLCPLCGYSQPRIVDDELPLDVKVTCTSIGRWHGVWFICGERYAANSSAVFALCPRCATRSDTPLSPHDHRRRQ